jgi:hypothetical protein
MGARRFAVLGVCALLASSSRASAQASPEALTRSRHTFQVASDAAWYAERAALLAELRRREAQWVFQRPPAYRVRALWASMTAFHRGELVTVIGSPLVVCDTVGAPASAQTRDFVGHDVLALFRELRTALADTTRAVFVEFDSTYGFPASMQISDRWITDTGYIRRWEHFRSILPTQAHCAAI